MYAALTGPITAELAEAETDRLFDDAPVGLPLDLTSKGWKLIERGPGRMFAVSQHWGCTGTKATLGAVVTEARGLMSYVSYRTRKEAERREMDVAA